MKRYALLLAILAAGTSQAWAWSWNSCAHEKTVEATLNLDGSDKLSVLARAGDLRITGHSGTSKARVRGKVCASAKKWLDQAELVTEGGRAASVAVSLPDVSNGWNWHLIGSHYVYMDLEIEVPDSVPLDIRDSSGDIRVAGTASIKLQDSSGDIQLEDVDGTVTLQDSSGDVHLEDINGDVLVLSDSSGDIYGRDIKGSARVEKDSSGDIRFLDVAGDFVVQRDSSGDIVADGVGGDFRVLKDGSGKITSSGVSGKVDIPFKG